MSKCNTMSHGRRMMRCNVKIMQFGHQGRRSPILPQSFHGSGYFHLPSCSWSSFQSQIQYCSYSDIQMVNLCLTDEIVQPGLKYCHIFSSSNFFSLSICILLHGFERVKIQTDCTQRGWSSSIGVEAVFAEYSLAAVPPLCHFIAVIYWSSEPRQC